MGEGDLAGSILERVAMAIAKANGDAWEDTPIAKWHWIDQRGMFGGHPRDINQPMQSDYLAMADAALTAMREINHALATAQRDMEACRG